MSQIGYYRYKVSDSIQGEQTVKFFKNGALKKTCTIIGKQFCPGFRLLKYLNSDGQYRFFPFNDKWQQTDKPVLIGTVSKFLTSITSDQTDSTNIGYKNERKLTLTAGNISQDEMDKLVDIFVSPRVYLYVGNGLNDELKDWIQVTLTGDGIGRQKKNNFRKVVVDITLPEYYAITKI